VGGRPLLGRLDDSADQRPHVGGGLQPSRRHKPQMTQIAVTRPLGVCPA
jgi:hypothetical protein